MFAIFDAMSNNQSLVDKSVSLFRRIFSGEVRGDHLACEVIVKSQRISTKNMNAIEDNEISNSNPSQKRHQNDVAQTKGTQVLLPAI